MLKEKLIKLFKQKFGGSFTKENGKIYWIKDSFKELVTVGFLKYFIDKNEAPDVKKVVETKEETTKKVKKNAEVPTNPEISEGS